MGIFSSIFKAAPVRNPADNPGSPLGVWKGQQRRTVDYQTVIAAEEALRHPVVLRCLKKISEAVQQVTWYAEEDPTVIASERASATTIKALNALLKSPNDSFSPEEMRFWMALTFAVYGRLPFKVGVGVGGVANGIYPLDARYLVSIADGRGLIRAYEYGASVDKQTYSTRKTAKEGGSYVHEVRLPNLSGTYEVNLTCGNVITLNSMGLPAAVVKMLLQRAYDTASGHPNTKYIVTAEKTLTEKQKQAVKEHMESSGPSGEEAGNILFLYNTTVKVDKLDNDLSDIHSKMPADDMTRMIAGGFGIPIALLGLGAADGAKYAGNYSESRQSFWEDTIIPGYLTPIAGGLTRAVCPYGARICFDLDSIDAIKSSRSARAAEIEDVTFLTNDEKRELAGFPPLTQEQRTRLEQEAALRQPAKAPKAPVASDPNAAA